MAAHKAPTQVTVVTEEKSALSQWVESNWKMWAALAVAISAVILGYQYMTEQSRQSSMAQWDRLNEVASISPGTGMITADLGELKSVTTELSGSEVEPFALIAQIQVALGERDYATANEAISALRKINFDPLTKDTFELGSGSVEGTLTDHLAAMIGAQQAWESGRESLFGNPDLPEGSPKVELDTTAGKIVLGLYQEAAPKHVENFLKHVDEGFYVGTRFHRVLQGFMVQGGDPNTKDTEKKAEWGQGGPGYKLDKEDSGLNHFKGYLSAAKMPQDVQSSGSQFFITTGDAHWLDNQHVVYGVVVSGMETVTAIEEGEIDPEDAQGSMPLEPVEILGAKRL